MKTSFLFLFLCTFPAIFQAQVDTTTIDSLNRLSEQLYYAAKHEQALDVALLATEHCQSMEEMTNSCFEAEMNLISIAMYINDLELATKHLEKAEKMCIKHFGVKDMNYADIPMKKGNMSAYQEDLDKTVEYYLEAIDIFRAMDNPNPEIYADALGTLGNYFDQLGRYNEAETYIRESLVQIKKSKSPDPYLQAVYRTNLAGVLSKIPAKHAEAEKMYLESLKSWESIYGKLHPNYAITVGNLAFWCMQKGNYEKAETYLKEALKLKKQIVGENHIDYLYDLKKMACIKNERGNTDRAIEILSNLLTKTKQLNGQENIFYLACLNDMIDYRLDRDETDTIVKDLISEALLINLQLDKNPNIDKTLIQKLKNPAFILSETELGNTQASIYRFFKTEHPEIAFQFACNNVQLFSQEKNQNLRAEDRVKLLKQTALAAEASINAIYESIQEGKGDKDELFELSFEMAEYNKSMLLQSVIRSKDALTFGNIPDSLIQKEQFYREELAYLKSLLLGNQSKEEKADVHQAYNSLHKEQNDLVAKLAKEYPDYHNLKYEFKVAQIPQIQSLLKEKEAFVEYVVGRDELFLFYISKKKTELFRFQYNLRSLAPHIKDLHRVLSNYTFINNNPEEAKKIFETSAHFFYKELLAPALELEKGIEHLVIVTDGTLGHLPFEVFLTKASQGDDYKSYPYLINDYSISYHYSATLWTQQEENPKKIRSAKMLGMAASYPEIKNVAQIDRKALDKFQRLRLVLNDLPAAKKEVEGLAASFDGTFYFDEEASEKNFTDNAADYSIIHLAMHGILDAREPLLSSMAFSDNSIKSEDNFLQAWEISHQQLNADLVVLSACETGYGKFEQGEGVLSLSRSFMYAGVPSLVVSLWQVNDYATAEIMKAFYSNLSEGKEKAEALRQAKLNFLNLAAGLTAHPAFWSPFIQIGDNRPIPIAKKGSSSPYLWAGLVAVLLFGGLFFRRKFS